MFPNTVILITNLTPPIHYALQNILQRKSLCFVTVSLRDRKYYVLLWHRKHTDDEKHRPLRAKDERTYIPFNRRQVYALLTCVYRQLCKEVSLAVSCLGV